MNVQEAEKSFLFALGSKGLFFPTLRISNSFSFSDKTQLNNLFRPNEAAPDPDLLRLEGAHPLAEGACTGGADTRVVSSSSRPSSISKKSEFTYCWISLWLIVSSRSSSSTQYVSV